MKSFPAMLVGCVIIMAAASAAGAGPSYRLEVDGLACPFCAYGIEKEMKAIDGVESVDIDIGAGIVTAVMADGAAMTRAQAEKIVRDAGFALRGFEELGPRLQDSGE